MMVHFIEDSAGYAEKIYLDISEAITGAVGSIEWRRADSYFQPWDNRCQRSVPDPIIRRQRRIILLQTDLRVFGGDNAGWAHGRRTTVPG